MKKTTKKLSKESVKVIKEVNDSLQVYTATVKILGKLYTATGSTISEAIAGLKIQNCKGRAILTIEHNGVKKDRIFMPAIASRLFNTMGFTREVALKNASTLFQGL